MSKKIKNLIAVIFILLFGGMWIGQNINDERISFEPEDSQDLNDLEKPRQTGRGESADTPANPQPTFDTELSFIATKESTVYELMDDLRAQGEISFTEKSYIGMGKLMDSIGGIKSGGEKTWIYYVNGKKAEVGVSNYKLKPGDAVSWKYEKLLAY